VPLTWVSLTFEDVVVHPDLQGGSFSATIGGDLPARHRRLAGRFRFDGSHVLTAVVVPAREETTRRQRTGSSDPVGSPAQ
jgi:hypothetical protein